MIEQKELISDILIRKWTNPQRAKKINDLEKRKEIANKDIRENITKLIQEDWDQINAYFLQCDQKILNLRHFDNLQDAQELMRDAPPQQRAKYIKSIKDEYLDKYANLSKGTKRQDQENSNVLVCGDGVIEIVEKKLDPGALYVSKYKNDPRVIRPNPTIRAEKKLPLITLNDRTFLTYGASSLITALPGNGKSSVCLAICSKVINRDCDGLGFDMPDPSIQKVLYFDGELDLTQADENFIKLINRSKVSTETLIEKFRYIGTANIDNVMERREMIEEEIKEFKPQLVIIDGSADLVNDPNNGEECIKLKSYIRHLTSTYKIGIILTIHPNPGSDRPQGHLGSKMWQEVGSSIILKRTFDGGSISSDFSMGKKRHSPTIHLKGNFIYDKDKEDLFIGDPNLLSGRPKKLDLCELDEIELIEMQKELRQSLTYKMHLDQLMKYCKLKHPGYAVGLPSIVKLHHYLISRSIILSDKIGNKTEYHFTDPNQGSIAFKKE